MSTPRADRPAGAGRAGASPPGPVAEDARHAAGAGAPGLHAALLRNTGYLVSRVGSYATRRFGEQMATLGLSSRMWGALNVLASEDGISQQALGRAIGMDPSSMVATIDTLESLGYVERRAHPSDRRAHALHVTSAGRLVLERGRELARQAQEELLAPLSERERAQLHGLLLRLAVAAHDATTADAARAPNAADLARTPAGSDTARASTGDDQVGPTPGPTGRPPT